MVFGRDRVEYKTEDQVRKMRRAGLVVAEALAAVRAGITPGVTTAELDELARDVIAGAGADPSFLGYYGYPAVTCISVNEEVVHGIPGERVLAAGDVISVDCGAIIDGWHGDSAFTAIVPGAEDPADAALRDVTEAAMWAGVAATASAERLGDIGAAIEDAVRAGEPDGAPYGILRDYVGHGIGTAMHQPPDVLNYRSRERGQKIKPGLCIAIEPMVVRGAEDTRVLADDWTVVTEDGSRAAHWEHTVAIFPEGISVLTAPDRGAAALAKFGIVPLDFD